MDFRRVWLALVLGFALGGPAAVVQGGPAVRRSAAPARIQRESRAQGIDNLRRIDVNTINMFLTNYGSFAWDLTSGNAGLVWPKGTSKTAVFAAGLWFGAVVNNEVRTVVAEYSQEYGPGPMVGGKFADPSYKDYRTWKVVRYTGDARDTAHVERDANEPAVEDPLIHHSWSEYMKGAAPYGAPWKTYHLPITDTSDPNDFVDVPGPDVLGDMMMWTVYNDADQKRHTNDAGSSKPLGLEIQQTTFAFNRQGALGNIVFLKFKIINKGANDLDSMFVSVWSDPDLGGAADDLVGVDTAHSLGFCYNSTNNDQLYGSAPPAVGYDFFQGPLYIASDPTSPRLPMTSFNKYINGTDPSSTSDTYNYMNGLLPDGGDVIDPTTGLPTKFFHPGDPTTGQGWLDSNPADRRLLLTSGPFYMSPGDSEEVVAAVIIGNGTDRLSSISALKFYDEFAQLAFDEGFQLPNPPPQPRVGIDQEHGLVTLSWDAKSRTDYVEPGYRFEGYNVYQGASIAGPWKRLATFDEINNVLTVRDTVFDLATGQTINDFPVAFGTDAGVSFVYSTNQDAIRGGNLRDATEYYFAVTAYAYSSTEKAAVVENAQQPIRIIPQQVPGGTELPGTPEADYSQVDSNQIPSTDQVLVEVVDPNAVLTADYQVTFQALNPPFVGPVGGTVDTVFSTWTLTRTSDVPPTVLFTDQVNRRDNNDYRVVDGLRVKVQGSFPPSPLDYQPGMVRAVYRNLVLADDTGNPLSDFRALEAALNWSGNPDFWFFGGAGYGIIFHDDSQSFGSSLNPYTDPDRFSTVNLSFNFTTSPQKAYRFVRMEKADGSAPASFPDRGYRFGGFVDVPVRARNGAGSPITLAFVEREIVDDAGVPLADNLQPSTHDNTWRPDEDKVNFGGREYLFAIDIPYNATQDPAIAQDGILLTGTLPVLYVLWARVRDFGGGDLGTIDDGDAFRFQWSVPAGPNDAYSFSSASLTRGNAALAKSLLDRIRVVPNPYFNRSRYELNQFARKVRFVNMPEVATVRIFNLAGELVRTLHKTAQNTSILEWDLLTESRLPVASGVYIFHVDSPGVGSILGRMAIFMEKERLNNF
jgi:hypothetical protein